MVPKDAGPYWAKIEGEWKIVDLDFYDIEGQKPYLHILATDYFVAPATVSEWRRIETPAEAVSD